jgi:hypothetical protein
LLRNHTTDRAKEVFELLAGCLYDPDELVRVAVLQIVESMVAAKEADLICMMTADFVQRLMSRVKDRKVDSKYRPKLV